MTRTEAWMFHASAMLVGGTGLVYGWMRYLLEPVDEFAVIHHPWQPTVQHLHIWFAPLLVFAFGHFWYSHAWVNWRKGIKSGQRSGITLMLISGPMAISGYLLQTAVSDGWRLTWTWVHGITGSLWLIGYLMHISRWFLARRATG